MTDDSAVWMDSVTKVFGQNTVLEEISLRVGVGEFVAILGPSGAGKSTLLRIIGGHLRPDSGDIWIHGQRTTGLHPERIPTATVFQSHALFPHLTVAENVGFGLKAMGWRASKIKERVAELLELVGLAGFGTRRVSDLSGGESQRVATARALAVEPKVMLMDEPLAALDRHTRERLQVDLKELVTRLGLTTLYVTHDQGEALMMADRVVVLNGGVIQQVGEPTEVYARPTSEFVARFVGGGNLITAVVDDHHANGDLSVRLGDLRMTAHGDAEMGSTVRLVARQEDVLILGPGSPDTEHSTLPGVVRLVQYHGASTRYIVEVDSPMVDDGVLTALIAGVPSFASGDTVNVAVLNAQLVLENEPDSSSLDTPPVDTSPRELPERVGVDMDED